MRKAWVVLAALGLGGCAEDERLLSCFFVDMTQCDGRAAGRMRAAAAAAARPVYVYVPVPMVEAPYSVRDDIDELRRQLGSAAVMQQMQMWDIQDGR